MSGDTTLAVLTRLIQETIGEDWALDEPITRQTSFADELELESIEFVVLAEKLQAHYGARVDFVGWLSDKPLEGILALTVGDVAGYIDNCVAGG